MKKLAFVLLAVSGFVFAQGCTCAKQEEQPAAVETTPADAPTDAVPTEQAPTETAPTSN